MISASRYSLESPESRLSPDGSSHSSDSDTFTVVVEGNIGVGKSTFLDYLRKSNTDVEVHAEPVHLWKNVGGYNALEKMYSNPERWSLAFQSYVQLTMLQIHTAKHTAPIKMMERSLYSARYCFVENLRQSGKMADFDFQIINKWYDFIWDSQQLGVDLIVYLRSSPETCLQRMIARGRTEEADVPLEYLQSLHKLHEDWLMDKKFDSPSIPILVLDADKDLEQFKLDVEEKKPQIFGSQS